MGNLMASYWGMLVDKCPIEVFQLLDMVFPSLDLTPQHLALKCFAWPSSTLNPLLEMLNSWLWSCNIKLSITCRQLPSSLLPSAFLLAGPAQILGFHRFLRGWNKQSKSWRGLSPRTPLLLLQKPGSRVSHLWCCVALFYMPKAHLRVCWPHASLWLLSLIFSWCLMTLLVASIYPLACRCIGEEKQRLIPSSKHILWYFLLSNYFPLSVTRAYVIPKWQIMFFIWNRLSLLGKMPLKAPPLPT